MNFCLVLHILVIFVSFVCHVHGTSTCSYSCGSGGTCYATCEDSCCGSFSNRYCCSTVSNSPSVTIAGAVLGGLFVIFVIMAIFIICYKGLKKRNNTRRTTVQQFCYRNSVTQPPAAPTYPAQPVAPPPYYAGPPPRYTSPVPETYPNQPLASYNSFPTQQTYPPPQEGPQPVSNVNAGNHQHGETSTENTQESNINRN